MFTYTWETPPCALLESPGTGRHKDGNLLAAEVPQEQEWVKMEFCGGWGGRGDRNIL